MAFFQSDDPEHERSVLDGPLGEQLMRAQGLGSTPMYTPEPDEEEALEQEALETEIAARTKEQATGTRLIEDLDAVEDERTLQEFMKAAFATASGRLPPSNRENIDQKALFAAMNPGKGIRLVYEVFDLLDVDDRMAYEAFVANPLIQVKGTGIEPMNGAGGVPHIFYTVVGHARPAVYYAYRGLPDPSAPKHTPPQLGFWSQLRQRIYAWAAATNGLG